MSALSSAALTCIAAASLLLAACGGGAGSTGDAGLDGTAAADGASPADAAPDGARPDAPDVFPPDVFPPDGAPDGAPDGGPTVEEQRAAVTGVAETERWSLPGLHAPVHVLRTEADVPHIYATDDHDLYLVQGFLIGRDRYFMFELGRRLGLGRISELLGDALLATDVESRVYGWTAIADRLLSQLTPEQEVILDAFTEGLNAYMTAVTEERLPPPSELTLAAPLLGVTAAELLQPVGRRDALGFAAVIVSRLGFEAHDVVRADSDGRIDAAFVDAPNAALRRAGLRRDVFESVAPVEDVNSGAGWGLETGDGLVPPVDGPARAAASAPPSAAGERARAGARRPPAQLLARAVAQGARVERHLGIDRPAKGSNAWAVGAAGTAWGGGLLSGDGHLELSVPSLFYQIGMDTQVFGADGRHLTGLVFPGLPFLAVGTNGHVAWSQTYHNGDVTDWYLDEVRLGPDGLPAESLFLGAWRPIERTDEAYVIANVPALGSVGRTETWPRFATFDGRRIVTIEGRAVGADDPLEAGEARVLMPDGFVVPGDEDGDGRISALSFDYTGFDVSNIFSVVQGFHAAGDVHAFREATRGLVAYAQNIVAADSDGGVFYTGYNAVPCRGYLDRDANGEWARDADPRKLLDGTRYGGFRVPLDADGRVDESLGAEDPYACVVPFDAYPQSLDPARGFVLNANNDIGGVSHDDSLANDPWYVGGPYVPGYRARVIHDTLAAAVPDRAADVAAMATLQADHRLLFARDTVPFLLESLAAARAARDAGPADAAEERLVALYEAEPLADDLAARFEAWLAAGAPSPSGVATFYHTPAPGEGDHAVAAMLFHAWIRGLFAELFGDEDIDFVWRVSEDRLRATVLVKLLRGRGPDNPRGLASWDPATGESVFFDDIGTPEVETSAEIALRALARALGELRGSGTPGFGGFGNDDPSTWLWGLKHQVRFESLLADFADASPAVTLLADQFAIKTRRLPLADDLPAGDPRRGLSWFPRGGGLYTVDAGDPYYQTSHYHYDTGPVMRMVIALDHGRVWGQNVVPGGQSALTDSPHFDDQAALWLGNLTLPLRFHTADVVGGATGREVYEPAP